MQVVDIFGIEGKIMRHKAHGEPVDGRIHVVNGAPRGSGLSKSHISMKGILDVANIKAFESAKFSRAKPITGKDVTMKALLDTASKKAQDSFKYGKDNILTIHRGAKLVSIHIQPMGNSEMEFAKKDSHLRTKRGKVKDWSKKAQARFKRKIARTKRSGLENALTMTLTYPFEFPPADDHRTYKGHLNKINNFMREMGLCGFWKLEFQERGAPHFHFLVIPLKPITPKQLKALRTIISQRWYEIVNSGDPKHLSACLNLEPVKTVDGAVGYLTGYMGKAEQLRPGNFTGHYTGTFNRKLIPWGEEDKVYLGREKAIKARRVMRKLIPKFMQHTHYKRIQKRIKKEYNTTFTRWDIERAFMGLRFKNSEKLKQYLEWLESRPAKKWRLRNSTTVNLVIDSEHFERAMERWFTSDLRCLRNQGVLP